MFKKILVAIDFSGPTMELLNAVDDLKKLGMEEMLIIHVIRLETADGGISTHRRRFLQKIEEKCREFEQNGLNIRIFQPIGSPAEDIKRVSEEENVDLILIGSIGEGSRVRELFLGSTVNNVIRITKKPVLIEKYEKKGKEPLRKKIFREDGNTVALLTTDFSRSSLQTFDFFLENKPVFKKYILFNVVDEGYTREQIAENQEKAMGKLASWQQEFNEKGFEAEIDVSVGVASEEIRKKADEVKAGLVVISRRGRGIINELLIGSTADPVVRHCSRPVLLLKQ